MNIIPFQSSAADLARAGGKGANLARLTRAGFVVPAGFIVSTAAYHAFVAANGLQNVIASATYNLSVNHPPSFDAASAQIRAAFHAGQMPVELQAELQSAYAELGQTPVAVRSSATAEDLPDLSFAGQQDTLLNVIGDVQLLAAVITCWSSLWTARAISYRLRNHITHDEVSLAVVVQLMVASDVSGVLFTVNPLTGQRRESVIDATFGLGEALVSGQVEPDHIVATHDGKVLSHTLGSKSILTRGKPDGGIETILAKADQRSSLSDDEIRQLVALGQQVQTEYGTPQDIEWAFAAGKLYLLQARPITSLFPVPEIQFAPLKIWFSFGAVQGLLAPISPLGRSVLQYTLNHAASVFGAPPATAQNTVMRAAGERLWMDVSGVLRHPMGKHIYQRILSMVEPSSGQILQSLVREPDVGLGSGKVKLITLRRLSHFMRPMFGRVLYNIRQPEQARKSLDQIIENLLAHKIDGSEQDDRFTRLNHILAYIHHHFSQVFPIVLPQFVPLLGASIAGLGLLGRLANDTEGADGAGHGMSRLVLEATRGLPNNVTTEMDLALWQTAQIIRRDAMAFEHFQANSAESLAEAYLAGALPSASQSAIAQFMLRYGMRGVGEFDMGQARWREAPAPVMHTLQSYLQISPDSAPDLLFQRGAQNAEHAIDTLAARAQQQPLGKLRAKGVRAIARRMRMWMGARETPKFFIIRLMGNVRAALLQVGEAFVNAGTLARPDDLFFLTLPELEALAASGKQTTNVPDWATLVAERRAANTRESRRPQLPRVLASDGRAFYEGLGNEISSGEALSGSPVSPGVVEGMVHVVYDPRKTQLMPGEILVCLGTDPAWTPLFMSAGGLITEVGGMMTHGSVVAREYGIPAVVGVHQATQRLKDGQRIRVDGTTGKIVIL